MYLSVCFWHRSPALIDLLVFMYLSVYVFICLFLAQVTSETSAPTRRNAVIMGRKTWDSIPPKFRPLPGRLNIVLSTTLAPGGLPGAPDVEVQPSLEGALAMLASDTRPGAIERVFVIGGGQLFREAMQSHLCEAVHLTEVTSASCPGGAGVDASIPCDTFFPPVDAAEWQLWSSSSPVLENGHRLSFLTYVRRGAGGGDAQAPAATKADVENCPAAANAVRTDAGTEAPSQTALPEAVLPPSLVARHEEHQYLDLIRRVIATGVERGDRTGTGTLSLFGCQMRFNLRKSFPLLTTKRVFWRGVSEELLWFISGDTSAKTLQDKGIKIWDGNGSREYLDSIGLTDREAGDLGPVYGFQWRHFGARYTNMHADYKGQGVDQLAEVIAKIRSNPTDRRLVISAWNPADLQLMALPPCHMFCQFYVAHGELSCQMYQRSCDLGLGVPFNIASYSLLTCLIAHVCDLVPGDFVHVLGDAHVYLNHVDALKQQLQNAPRPFPTLRIKTDTRDIDAITFQDLELSDYNPHGKIAMKMAV
eukprot:jgi/Mesvir1/24379/Mv11048-RA.4